MARKFIEKLLGANRKGAPPAAEERKPAESPRAPQAPKMQGSQRDQAELTVFNPQPTAEPSGQPESQPAADEGPLRVSGALVAIDGPMEGQAFPVFEGQRLLGRGPDCNPQLESPWISRLHADLICTRGRFEIVLKEGKEVKVNDEDVSTRSQLSHGDQLTIGRTTFCLLCMPVATVAATEEVAVPEEAPAQESNSSSGWLPKFRKKPRLVFVNGSRQGEKLNLGSGSVRVGASPDNDIVIPAEDVSRSHAELRIRDDKVVIWDLQAVNGTYVNGDKVHTKELKHGDMIQIGKTQIRYET